MKYCCEVRQKLAEEFSTAARLYAEAVVILATVGMSEARYSHLCRVAEQAQNRAEVASAAFKEHIQQHRCFNVHP